jgi:hypothetical protein
VTLEVSGGVGGYAAANGSWTIPWFGPCGWYTPAVLGGASFQYNPGNLLLQFSSGPWVLQYTAPIPWDCVSPVTAWTNTISTDPFDPPPSVIVWPF